MMRKQISLMNPRQLTNQLPFYAWDCITLSLKSGEDVFLLIKDEQEMMNFLKFLIYSLETIDGKRGSATPFIEKKVFIENRRLGLYSDDHTVNLAKVENKIREDLMHKVLFKYKLMRVMQKISFQALKRRMTLKEHWFQQILVSFKLFRDSGQIESKTLAQSKEDKLYEAILNGEERWCIKALLKFYLDLPDNYKAEQPRNDEIADDSCCHHEDAKSDADAEDHPNIFFKSVKKRLKEFKMTN